jgi:hypothetical protein
MNVIIFAQGLCRFQQGRGTIDKCNQNGIHGSNRSQPIAKLKQERVFGSNKYTEFL